MTKTTYMWDELSDNVAAEYDDGVLSAAYTHEPGLYGNLLSQNRNGGTSYYHYDGRGDTVALTDDGGNVTDTKEYDAWGNVISSTGSTVTPYQFSGRQGYQTGGTGVYFRAKIYQPTVARWMSARSCRLVDRNCRGTYGTNSPLALLLVHRDDLSAFLRLSAKLSDDLPKVQKVAQKLPCKTDNEGCNCLGDDCTFAVEVKLDANREFPERLCFSQSPGELPNDPRPPTRVCSSEINRPGSPDDHFTITVRGRDKPCKFTANELPPTATWPPDWTKPALVGCREAFQEPGLEPDPRGVAFGGCYMFTQFVTKIEVNFSLDISCGCDLERSKGKLTLKEEF